MNRHMLGGLLLVLAGVPAAAPPPPPRPGQERLMRNLVADLKARDVSGYTSLLSDQVHVYEDGRLVAQNKQEWMRLFGPFLADKTVVLTLGSGYFSTQHFLFMEYTNTSARGLPADTAPRDCCWNYTAVRYDIANDKIVTIRILNAGDRRLEDNGNPDGN